MFREDARIGIVVPTLGERPEWLAQAVASVECQGSYVELAIVGPPRIVPAIRRQFPGRKIIAEIREGVVPAIEAGWRALDTCNVLSWLGDDDQLTPNSVTTALPYLLNNRRAEMVYGDYEYIDEADRHIVSIHPGRSAPLWLKVGQNFIAQPGCLYTRVAIAACGGLPDDLRLAFDVALHVKLARHAVYCPATLATVRVHPLRLTLAEREASAAEFGRAVWGCGSRRTARGLLARLGPIWHVAGRLHYRFHREYRPTTRRPYPASAEWQAR